MTAALTSPAPAEVPAAEDDLMAVLEEQLRRLAGSLPLSTHTGRPVPAHALVREAYARLVDPDRVAQPGRSRFYLAAARAIRSILVEGSRQSAATPALAGEGRSGVAVPALDRDSTDGTLRPGEILALDRALARLEDLDPQEEKVFELRCFAGLDDGGIAEALGVPAQSVARDWAHARSWVCRELARAAGAIG